MNNHISIRLENCNDVSTWLIILNNKNIFDSNLIKWLDFEYATYMLNYPNICIYIQLTFDNVNYSYPLSTNKPYKINPNYDSPNSTDTPDLQYFEDLDDYLPPSKKLKRANAVTSFDISTMTELDSTLKYIFSNFSN